MKNKKVYKLAKNDPEFEDNEFRIIGLRKNAQIEGAEYERDYYGQNKSLAERSNTNKRLSKRIHARKKAKKAAEESVIAEELSIQREYEQEVRERLEKEFGLA